MRDNKPTAPVREFAAAPTPADAATTRAAFARLMDSPGAPRPLNDNPGATSSVGTRAVEAWFLGPKAENADEFERLVIEAIRDHAYWRRNYHPADPTHITPEIKRSPEYLQAVGDLQESFGIVLAWLKKSVPFFSMRYQGHMNWDLTIPGMLGYFAGMLYNPNNVAFEGSTATTILELLVGDDLCRMLGYTIPAAAATPLSPAPASPPPVRPWGHITCDGTVANIEAMWAARNLKFYPLALRQAVADGGVLASAAGVTVSTAEGESRRLTELGTWELLNLPADAVLALPGRIKSEFSIPMPQWVQVDEAVAKYSLQAMGQFAFARRFLADLRFDPVVLVAGTKHYSHPKAAALLGLGAANLLDLPVDINARVDIPSLRAKLEQCLNDRRPVISVTAVIGSTEESAIDPLEEILALRHEFSGRGMSFHVHADAAWGGYHRSVINEPFDLPDPNRAKAAFAPAQPPPAAPLSAYSVRQLTSLSGADSITVDPHKSGYVPYPAGALCYRNGSMRNLVTFSAPVVYHGEAEPTVGIYGVEGSKPGAAAAAVYLSHRVIRPDRNGYGKVIGQALFSCRKLYARLLTMAKPTDPFVIVPVPLQPSERAGTSAEDVAEERRKIAELIDGRSSQDIINDKAAMTLLAEIGPDENILSYAFNFRRSDGSINDDLELANVLNRSIYGRLSIDPGRDIYEYDLIVSTTDFDESAYGPTFMRHFKSRLGVGNSPGTRVTVLRSVVMDPWVTETRAGSFIDVLEGEFRRAVAAAIAQVHNPPVRGF
jgi:glutamate/tyrosine decarboxylase-like PLP-dependent enzyme